MNKILILGDNYYIEKYFENRMSIFKIPKKRNVISFLKTNDINNIYVCDGESRDMNFYEECVNNDINVLNDKIFFKDDYSIERTVRYTLKIPILIRTNVLADYNNLVIESLERCFPQLLKSDDNVLLRINSPGEFIDYRDYIKNFIDFFDYNSSIYLQEIPENFRKVAIMFFINDDGEFIVMDSFDIDFTILKFNVIMKRPSIFINDLMKEDCEKISRKFGVNFGIAEFMLNGTYVNFYRLLMSDKLFHFADYLKDVHEFDIYKFKFENGVYNSVKQNDTPKLLINEITLNYGNFFPFFGIHNGKTNFFSKCYVHWGDDVVSVLGKCENLYFKEIVYRFDTANSSTANSSTANYSSNVIYNIYNKNNTYFFYIKNKKNCDIFFKNPQSSEIVQCMNRNIYDIHPRDTFNAKLANFILGNEKSSTVLEISGTEVCFIIYNRTFITITGSDSTNISVNDKQCKLNSIIEMKCMDKLIIKMDNYGLNYIAFSNGIKLNLSKRISDYSKLINNGYVMFNKPKNMITKNSNVKLLLPAFYTNYDLKVIESAFTDKFDPKMIKHIYKLKWSVKKVSSEGILLVNKYYGKLYKKYNVECSILKRYCKGSVIFNKSGLLIVINDNYDYHEGFSIMTVISSDNWKLNYVKDKSHLNFQKVSLDYAINRRVGIDNIFNKSDVVYRKMGYLDGIKRTKTVLLSFIDKINLIGVECRLMGDRHLIVEYSLDVNNKLRDNMFVEFGFRQKLIENEICLDALFGLSSYIVKFDGDDIDKIVMTLYSLEKKISHKNSVMTRVVKLPVVLDKKYFLDKKYVVSLLKINEIDDIDDVKDFIERMKFFVVDINSVNPGTICLIPHNPVDRVILVKRDINQVAENGTISFGNFFCNIHYNEGVRSGAIVAKTIPLTDKKLNFILNRFDTVMFKMINNNSFNSILDHNRNGKYFMDTDEAEFNISEYRNFFNSGLEKFIEKKSRKIKIYESEKKIHNRSIPNDIVNIHHIKAPFDCVVKEIYVKLNDNIKFTDKLCKIVDSNRVKSNMKSNMIGMITSIHVSVGTVVKEGETIISALQC